MENKLYGTRLYIHLDKLKKNIDFLLDIAPNSKIIAMVKANAYGFGDIQIAKELNSLGINYFGVADFEEGIRLKKNQIKGSIIVMNPGLNNLKIILDYQLEPVIYNWSMLRKLESIIEDRVETNSKPIIHLKFNTGMNRWGFDFSDVHDLIIEIKKIKKLRIGSIYSHLSSANDLQHDIFTDSQISQFKKIKHLFFQAFQYKIHSHILNSSAILRHGDYINDFNYLRLGMMLYGGVPHSNLVSISELRCPISDIRVVRSGASVGYGNNFIASKEIKVATVPFGYADGLQRQWGNGVLKFYYNNKLLPTIGNISMDSCAIDISMARNIRVGEEVLYFGNNRPIWSLAKDLNTISYEISSTLSSRIKRIYQ